MSETGKYKDIDWAAELDEYFALGDYPIKAFARSKGYSYYAFKDRLYRDPRYHGRNAKWHEAGGAGTAAAKEPEFLPVVIRQSRQTDIAVNGFTLTLDENTDEIILKKLLTAIRSL